MEQQEQKSEVKLLSTEEVIQSAKDELMAVSPLAVINAIIEKNKALVITGVDDKAGEKAVDEARKEMKRYRLAIEEKRKALKAVSIRYGKEVDDTAKILTAPVEKEEERLKKIVEAVQAERKRIAEEEERKAIEKFNSRTEQLFSLGFTFNGTVYELGRWKATSERIRTATDEEWPTLIEKVSAEAQRLKAEKEAEAARVKAVEEENERLRQQLANQSWASAVQPAQPTQPTPTHSGASWPNSWAVSIGVTSPAPQPQPQPSEPQLPQSDPQAEFSQQLATVKAALSEATASESERYLSELLAGVETPNAAHFKAGYRKGVEFMKRMVIDIISDPNLKGRGEIKDRVNAL